MKSGKYQNLKDFTLPDNFRGRSALIVQLWWLVQSTLFAWSPQFMYAWRRCLLRIFGAQIGKKVLIRPTVKINYPWKVTIGDYSWIGDDVVLYSLGKISIGSNVVISQKSYICAGGHQYSRTNFDIYSSPINISNEVWVASDVFISPGVSIGRGSVIGARSTVLKDLPSGKVCYGNPAIPVREREMLD